VKHKEEYKVYEKNSMSTIFSRAKELGISVIDALKTDMSGMIDFPTLQENEENP